MNDGWVGTAVVGIPNPVLGVCCWQPKPLGMLAPVGATAEVAAGLRGLRLPKAGVVAAPMPNVGCCAATCGSGGLFVRLPKEGKGADVLLAGWEKAGAGWEPNEKAGVLASVFWPKTNCEVEKAGFAGSTAGAAGGGKEIAAGAVVAGARKPGSCPAVVVRLPPWGKIDGCCVVTVEAGISLGFPARPNENGFGAASAAVAGVPKLKGLAGVSTVVPNFGGCSAVAPNWNTLDGSAEAAGAMNLKVFAAGCCSSEEPSLTVFAGSSAAEPNLKPPPVGVSEEGVEPNVNGFAGSLTVDPKVNPLLGSVM